MKQQNVTAVNKDGQAITATVAIPETLEELSNCLGKNRLFRIGFAYYMRLSKRRIASGSKPRQRVMKLKLSELTPTQKAHLVQAGLMTAEE